VLLLTYFWLALVCTVPSSRSLLFSLYRSRESLVRWYASRLRFSRPTRSPPGGAPQRTRLLRTLRRVFMLAWMETYVSGPALPHPSESDGGGLVGRSTIYYLIGTTAHQRPTHERAVRARPLCTRAALLPSRLALPVPHADCSGVCSPPQSSVDATLQAAQAIHAPYRLCRGRGVRSSRRAHASCAPLCPTREADCSARSRRCARHDTPDARAAAARHSLLGCQRARTDRSPRAHGMVVSCSILIHRCCAVNTQNSTMAKVTRLRCTNAYTQIWIRCARMSAL